MINFLQSLLVGIVSFFSFLYPTPVVQKPLGSAGIVVQTAAYFDTFLASAITNIATTATLNTNITYGTSTLANGTYSFVIDQGTQQQEVVEGVVSGTAITAMLRGVDFQNPNVTSTALAFAHNRGADIKITDYTAWGHITRIFTGLDNLPNIIAYNSSTITSTQISADLSNLASVGYVNGVASSGAANATVGVNGISQLATTAQIASGTVTGSTGANLVARSLDFGASSTARTQVPVTGSNGKLSQGFIDQTQSFNFTGGVTISSGTIATTTYTGTQSFGSSTLTGLAFFQKQVFNTNTTWTVPAGVTTLYITMTGGGGGGAEGAGSANGGGGGGSGQFLYRVATTTTAGTSFVVTIGIGGIGGLPSAGNVSSTNGTASLFGGLSAGGGNAPAAPGTSGGLATSTAIAGQAAVGAVGGNGAGGFMAIGGTGGTTIPNASGTVSKYWGAGGGGGAGNYGGQNGFAGGNGASGTVIVEY